MVLASANAIGLCLLRRAVSRRFGRPTAVMFVLLTCTQFHLLYWMGRTLPNMFALLPGMCDLCVCFPSPYLFVRSEYLPLPPHRPRAELNSPVQVQRTLGDSVADVHHYRLSLRASPPPRTFCVAGHPAVYDLV